MQHLENKLRESQEDVASFARQLHKLQEDLNDMIHHQQSKESLLMEEIVSLKAKLGEGGSGCYVFFPFTSLFYFTLFSHTIY